MQLGFVGLGKMGANMVHRIHRDSEHTCVAFDFNADAVGEVEGFGATGASALEDLVSKLEAPRSVWIMVPAGDPTQSTVDQLAELLDEGDTIIDGGNSRWTDDKRRQEALAPKGIHYVDVGVERRRLGAPGRLLHDGGRSRRGRRAARADPRRAGAARDPRARPRLGPLRADGRGPLREDGPQRRRVRDDAGVCGGLRTFQRVRVRARQRQDRPPLDAGLGRALVAVRAGGARVRAGGQRARVDRSLCRGLRARAAGPWRTRSSGGCRCR